MLSEAQTLMFQAPLLAVWPGVAIALAVLGLNLLGDGLRDLLTPAWRKMTPRVASRLPLYALRAMGGTQPAHASRTPPARVGGPCAAAAQYAPPVSCTVDTRMKYRNR
jgi:uncharacterized protein YjeT (DUF2065 family)